MWLTLTISQVSGIVPGIESTRVSATNILDQYMQVSKRIDEILIEVEQLKKNNKQTSHDNKKMKDEIKGLQEQAEKLIEERKKLRSDLNASMDNLEKQVEIINNTAEATRKESAKTSEDLESFKTNITEDIQKQLLKLEENQKKEIQALERRIQDQNEKDKKVHSEEISSLSRRINLNRLELLQQFHTQGKYQVEAALTNIRRQSKRFSLPAPLNVSSGQDELTNSLPPTPSKQRQRHISESSSGSDSGYSQIGGITPDKEGHFEFGPRRPPSAQSGRSQERVPTPLPNIHRRPSHP